jgi:hypothetical protein
MGFDNPHDIRSAGSANEQLNKLREAVVDLNVNYWIEVHGNPRLQAAVQFDAGDMLRGRLGILQNLEAQTDQLGSNLTGNSRGELTRLQTEIRELMQDIRDVTVLSNQPSQQRSDDPVARRLGTEAPAATAAAGLRRQRDASTSTGHQASTSSGFGIGRPA